MNNINLKELWAPIANGEIRIEDWWKQNESSILSIKSVNTDEEVIIWSASYYRYGMYLHNDGYSQQSLVYVNKAIEILENNKGKLYEKLYKDSLETMLEAKAGILHRLEKYWEAYKIMCTLCSMKPGKDDYRLGRKNLLGSCIAKVINPIYIVLAIIFALMLCEQYLTHTHFIPSIVWTITWAIWILLLVVQFVVPALINKIQK